MALKQKYNSSLQIYDPEYELFSNWSIMAKDRYSFWWYHPFTENLFHHGFDPIKDYGQSMRWNNLGDG